MTMSRIACAVFAAAAVTAPLAAQDHGDVTLTLQEITAVSQTGQPDPSRDAACQAEYEAWIGRTVTTDYTIDPRTMMMSATSTIEDVAVQLYPLGIQGIYVFMSDGVPPELAGQNVNRVIFQISIGYDHPESRILATLDDTVNCLIES